MVTRAERFGGPRGHPSAGLIIGIVAALAAVVVIALVAVFATRSGGSSKTDTATTGVQAPAVNTGQQVKTSEGLPAQAGEFKRPAGAVRIGDMLFTVVSVKTLDIKPPEAHLKYVAVELTAQNVGQLSASDWSMKLIDSDGVENTIVGGSATRARLGQIGEQSGNFIITGLKPGAQVQGPVIFTVLVDAKPKELRYSSKNGDSGIIPLK